MQKLRVRQELTPILDRPSGVEVRNFAAIVQRTGGDMDGVLSGVARMGFDHIVDLSRVTDIEQTLGVDTSCALGNLCSLLHDLLLSQVLAFRV